MYQRNIQRSNQGISKLFIDGAEDTIRLYDQFTPRYGQRDTQHIAYWHGRVQVQLKELYQ